MINRLRETVLYRAILVVGLLVAPAGTVHARPQQKPAAASGKLILNLPDRSIGTLRNLDNMKYPVDARGRLEFAPGTRLFLLVNYDTGQNLAPLKSIGPGVLWKLGMPRLEITDDNLANIKHLIGLKELDLEETDVSNRGLVHLKDMKRLYILNLRSTLITGAGLVHLKPLQALRILNLGSTNLGNQGLENLAELKQLYDLCLVRTRLDDAALRFIAPLKTIVKLDIQFNSDITDDGMAKLVGLTKLDKLMIARTSITAKSLPYIKQFRNLREFVFHDKQFSKKEIADLQKALPKCKIMDYVKFRDVDLGLYEPLH